MKIRRIIASLTLTILLISTLAPTVSAHILKTDGTIGAILHIEPDDNPTSGAPISFVLSFKDTAGRFTLPECDCNISITANDVPATTKALNASYALDSENTYTFPKPAVYILSVTGKPKQPGGFEPFTLTYTVRVEAGSQGTAKSIPPMLYIGINLVCIYIFLAFYKVIHNRSSKRSNHVKKSSV